MRTFRSKVIAITMPHRPLALVLPASFLALALTTAALTTAALTTAAQAGTVQMEARGGVNWRGSGHAKAALGAALSYDASARFFGTGGFVGVEQSLDRLTLGEKDLRWSTALRAGVQMPVLGKLYALGAYHYGAGPDRAALGAGLQKGFGPAYARVEYRQFLTSASGQPNHSATVGFGLRF